MMRKSGRPDLPAVIWTARLLTPAAGAAATRTSPSRIGVSAIAILVLLLGQIALGGLVAGLKAGLIYNTWPLIDGAFIPPREHLLLLHPPWLNLLDNHLAVQFTHRMLASVLVALAVLHAADCYWYRACTSSAVTLALVLFLQAMLGVATLLLQVPILLALAHRAVAIAALIAATLHAANLQAQPEPSFRHAAR